MKLSEWDECADIVEWSFGREKLEKPWEKHNSIPFRPPWNPHGVTETRTRDPSGGKQATNRLRYGAAQHIKDIPKIFTKIKFLRGYNWDMTTEVYVLRIEE